MLFNSYIFVLLFLPLALLGYYGLNHLKKYHTAKIFLIGMSLWFYAYFNYSYLFIILISIAVNYMVSFLVCKEKVKRCIRKAILVIGVVFDIGIIFYYKYFNFLLNNVNTILQEDFIIKEIIMPLGISFFTFQQISYLVDSWRGETKNYGVIDYVLFVSFFRN